MKKLIGFIAFWIAVGMLLMLLFFTSRFIGLIICALLLLIAIDAYRNTKVLENEKCG